MAFVCFSLVQILSILVFVMVIDSIQSRLKLLYMVTLEILMCTLEVVHVHGFILIMSGMCAHTHTHTHTHTYYVCHLAWTCFIFMFTDLFIFVKAWRKHVSVSTQILIALMDCSPVG